jgi:hypothetical protein
MVPGSLTIPDILPVVYEDERPILDTDIRLLAARPRPE